MAEIFEGVKPIETPLKPEQETLRDRQDVWDDEHSGDALDQLRNAVETPEEPDPATSPAEPDPATPPADDLGLPDPATIKLPLDAGTPPADDPKPADPYPDIQLPPNVRGKSAEAWAEVKQRFSTDLSARDSEIAQLKAQISEHEAKLKSAVLPDPNRDKEIEDLRQFKAKLDIEADPNFHKQFDGKIEQAQNFIFTHLASAGFSKESIAKIKEIGIDKVDWEGLSGKMEPQTSRLVQARLDEIEVAKYDKANALEAAKKNVDAYIQAQRQSYSQAGTKHVEETEQHLEDLTSKHLEFLRDPEPLKATATPDERAVFEAEAAHRQSIRDAMQAAKADDSPYMRAILIAGSGQLLNLKPRFEQLTEAHVALKSKYDTAMAWIDKVKAAGRARQKDAGADPEPLKPTVDYRLDAGSALDSYRKAQGG